MLVGKAEASVNVTLQVLNTDAIYIYCTPHCTSGMVFTVNAPVEGNGTFEEYQAAALTASTNTATSNSTPGTQSTLFIGLALVVGFCSIPFIIIIIRKWFC